MFFGKSAQGEERKGDEMDTENERVRKWLKTKEREWRGRMTRAEKSAKGGEPGLCEQFTDTDSTIFTICQYHLWSTTFETGTSRRLQGKVRSRRKKKKRPFEKRGGIGNPGLGRVLGWLGAEKSNPAPLKAKGAAPD